jgi:hypothetical protein
VEGNGNPAAGGHDTELQVRQRLAQADKVPLPSVDEVQQGGIPLDQTLLVQILAAQLAQLTALRDCVTLLAVEIDVLRHQSAPPA